MSCTGNDEQAISDLIDKGLYEQEQENERKLTSKQKKILNKWIKDHMAEHSLYNVNGQPQWVLGVKGKGK